MAKKEYVQTNIVTNKEKCDKRCRFLTEQEVIGSNTGHQVKWLDGVDMDWFCILYQKELYPLRTNCYRCKQCLSNNPIKVEE